MALVHNDEIKEVGREFFVEAGAALVLGDGLVRGEVEFAAEDDFAAFDLVPGVAEGGEGFVFGIIYEEVAVGEVEDMRFAGRIAFGIPLGGPELPADVEGDNSLVSARGHRQQHAALPLEDGLNYA